MHRDLAFEFGFWSFVLVFGVCCLFGCRTGQVVRLEQRSVSGITSVQIAEYTLPVISISSGPSFSTWTSTDVQSSICVIGSASTTNTVSALGLYDSTEKKEMHVDAVITSSPTNAPGRRLERPRNAPGMAHR